MKAKHFGLIGIATLMLTGCNGNMPAGKDLKDLQNATTEDSVANLLGQGQSMGYWQAAAQDSTLKTDKGREAYIKGFLKAMDIVSEDEAYNAGLRSGLDAALNLKAINKNYELNLNKDVYLQGYSLGMASDSAVNKEQLQTVMGNIGQRLEKQKADRDAKKADEALSARVKKDGLKRNGDYAYKILNQGSGALLENGDMVLVDISMTDASGKQIMPSQGNMPIEIGAPGLPQSVSNTLMALSPGAKAIVVAPLSTLGMRNNNPSDMVEVSIKVLGYCDEEGKTVTAPVKGKASKQRLENVNKNIPATEGKQINKPAAK